MKVKSSDMLSLVISLIIALGISCFCTTGNFWIVYTVLIAYLTQPCWLYAFELLNERKANLDDRRILNCIHCIAFVLIVIYSLILLLMLPNLTFIGILILILTGVFALTELILILSSKPTK